MLRLPHIAKLEEDNIREGFLEHTQYMICGGPRYATWSELAFPRRLRWRSVGTGPDSVFECYNIVSRRDLALVAVKMQQYFDILNQSLGTPLGTPRVGSTVQ